MIIIPIKWLFVWEYTLFSDKSILRFKIRHWGPDPNPLSGASSSRKILPGSLPFRWSKRWHHIISMQAIDTWNNHCFCSVAIVIKKKIVAHPVQSGFGIGIWRRDDRERMNPMMWNMSRSRLGKAWVSQILVYGIWGVSQILDGICHIYGI